MSTLCYVILFRKPFTGIVYDDNSCIFFSPVDVYIDVPDTIDISHMRSKGLQPWEELLPDGSMLSLFISIYFLGTIIIFLYLLLILSE